MAPDARILGVIPARGGSKGIPRKNLRLLCGKPLIQWTIEAARRSGRLERFVVSTEDPEIAQVARACGADVLDRPAALATDEASTLAVLQHAVEALRPTVVVVLQPTSPIRSDGLIDRCLERFLAAAPDSLATVHRDHSYEYGQAMPRRQDMPPRWVDNGNVYVIDDGLIRRGDRYGARVERVEISRAEGVEIDDEFDWWLAERVVSSELVTQVRVEPPQVSRC